MLQIIQDMIQDIKEGLAKRREETLYSKYFMEDIKNKCYHAILKAEVALDKHHYDERLRVYRNSLTHNRKMLDKIKTTTEAYERHVILQEDLKNTYSTIKDLHGE